MSLFREAAWQRNPAWVQLLGLCPLLAVTTTLENAAGLAVASTVVVVGSTVTVSAIRAVIPDDVRLPCFMVVIATFTTLVTMLMEAFAFDLYLRVALFVQIIVTNCMILGRIEQFASRQPVGRTLVDALGHRRGLRGSAAGAWAPRANSWRWECPSPHCRRERSWSRVCCSGRCGRWAAGSSRSDVHSRTPDSALGRQAPLRWPIHRSQRTARRRSVHPPASAAAAGTLVPLLPVPPVTRCASTLSAIRATRNTRTSPWCRALPLPHVSRERGMLESTAR